jgi:hypothetical protein
MPTLGSWAGSNVRWHGPLHLGGRDHQVPTLLEFELDARYLYWENQILIEALENWLTTLEKIL